MIKRLSNVQQLIEASLVEIKKKLRLIKRNIIACNRQKCLRLNTIYVVLRLNAIYFANSKM